MRYRALGLFAISVAFMLLIASSASGWTALAPITPSPTIPMIYTKALALEAGGGGIAPGIWVTEVGNNWPDARAYKYALTPTTLQQTIGAAASTNDDLRYPGGIAVNPSNHDVYISDTETDRILRFSSAGALISATSGNSGSPIKLDRPHGLKIAGNTLYIANSGTTGINRGIKRVSLDFSTWGADITSADFHSGPSDIAVDTAGGRIWAADEGYRHGEDDTAAGVTSATLGSVLRFDMNGVQKQRIVRPDAGSTQFGQPYSVEYDAAAGILYMADYYRDKFFALNASGDEVLDTFGPSAAPVAMSFDSGSRILYAGRVGSHGWPPAAGLQAIARIQAPPVPSCSSQPDFSTAMNTSITVTLNCDAGADTIRFEIISQPAHGDFTDVSANGSARIYVPDVGYSGSDIFSFRVVSKRGLSPAEAIVITVTAPDPPGPTGPTGPTTPIPPVIPIVPDPEPVVQIPNFPTPRQSAKPTLTNLRVARHGKSMVDIKGTLKFFAATGAPLQIGACNGNAELSLQAKKGRRVRTLNGDSAKLTSLNGACAAKFTLTTAARNRKQILSIRLRHPGNDSILPIDSSFKVVSSKK